VLKQEKPLKFIKKIVGLFRKVMIIILIKVILMKSHKKKAIKKKIISSQKIIR
jgi:hypothetical protein